MRERIQEGADSGATPGKGRKEDGPGIRFTLRIVLARRQGRGNAGSRSNRQPDEKAVRD